MAKFDLGVCIQNHDNFAGTLLLGAMSVDVTDCVKTYNLRRDEKSQNLEADIVITINGVELPFDKWLVGLEKQLGQMVTARAQVLLGERMRDFSEKLYNIEKNMEKESRALFPDLGKDEWDR